MKLQKALLDFDSHHEKRISHLKTQLEQQNNDMIGKINLLGKIVFEKLNNVTSTENAGNHMALKSAATIIHDEREELRKIGVKSPSKLLSPKYLSPASVKERNINLSSPKRVHLVNSIVILRTGSGMEEKDISFTNTCSINIGENDEEGDESETEDEVEEMLKEEEDKEDDGDFNSFPTLEELTHHEWLMKIPRPPWVRARIRSGNPNNIKIFCMIGHLFVRHAH
ncbi:hypothetical protein Tco_0655026 [Tanacetum coccineum]|uniref:Uncharacterized protein n=1 Tax=Tanacetum coccineum TaxID=301880 RepID=A0ABQ4X4U6_9ASTR